MIENTEGAIFFGLREILAVASAFWSYLWTKKWLVILIGITGGVTGGFIAWRSPVTYSANLTYMINEDDGPSMGGLGSVLGQFSLGRGGGSEYNLDKVVILSGSRRIIHNVLLDSVVIGGTKDLVANHLIDVYNMNEQWVELEDERLIDFRFTSSDLATFDRTSRKVLIELFGRMVGNPTEGIQGLMNSVYNDSGILSLSIKSENEEFSVNVTKKIYDKLSRFYIEQSIQKQKVTYDQISDKTDSVLQELRIVEVRLARVKDRFNDVLTRSSRIEEGRLTRDAQMLTIMYGEAIKNRESAEFLLSSVTPFFQVIDDVMTPLSKNKKSIPKAGVIGGVVGGVLIVGLFLTVFLFRIAMEE
jgi:uncharacterized protein involved in exopolysaccharide biosynthesis